MKVKAVTSNYNADFVCNCSTPPPLPLLVNKVSVSRKAANHQEQASSSTKIQAAQSYNLHQVQAQAKAGNPPVETQSGNHHQVQAQPEPSHSK